MRLEVVDLSANEAGGVEDAMAAVHHVVVEREHHQRRIGDHPAQLAGVERREFHRLAVAECAESGEYVGVRQGLKSGA